MLTRLITEAQGALRLARVDVDENNKLAQRFNIRSVPAIKAFNQGQVVSEFTGVLPEPRLRDFLRNLAPSPSDLLLEKANSHLLMHQWSASEQAYRDFLAENRDHPAGLLGLVRCLLARGETTESLSIIRNFPASHQFNAAQQLKPLAEAWVQLNETRPNEDDPLDAAYRNALRLAARANIPAALDGLLDILRQDKRYRNNQVRQVIIALIEILGDDDPLARQYRAELASILF